MNLEKKLEEKEDPGVRLKEGILVKKARPTQ